jgi:hypothetical protein
MSQRGDLRLTDFLAQRTADCLLDLSAPYSGLFRVPTRTRTDDQSVEQLRAALRTRRGRGSQGSRLIG